MILIIRKNKVYSSIFAFLAVTCLVFLFIKNETADPGTVKIFAVGDVMLGRYVSDNLLRHKKDYRYPFEKVKNIFDRNSVVFGNLECAITSKSRCLNPTAKYVLKNPIQALDGIRYCGFNMLSLANNHILDYYEDGLFETIRLLDGSGIAHSGAGRNLAEAGKAAVILKNSTKIGLISYTDMAEIVYPGKPPLCFAAGLDKSGVNPRPLVFTDTMREDIRKARSEADILMVSLHWGIEESFTVLPSQREFAHQLIENGVDIVLGTHPHQFQGIEVYHGRPIFYSLGNFIFDQEDPENKESFIIAIVMRHKKPVAVRGIPIQIVNAMQIVPLSGKGAEKLLQREQLLCQKLETACQIRNGQLVFEMPDDFPQLLKSPIYRR